MRLTRMPTSRRRKCSFSLCSLQPQTKHTYRHRNHRTCRRAKDEEWEQRMGTIAQRDLYRLISDANERGERVVVATVAHTRGSTPQQRGAKMLFYESGEV